MFDLRINSDRFKKIIQKPNRPLCKELDELFAELQPVTIGGMIGKWRVCYLLTEGTGSKFETFLRYFPIIHLYGKRFLSKNNVKAWVYSFCGVKVSIPGATAILEIVEYRKKYPCL